MTDEDVFFFLFFHWKNINFLPLRSAAPDSTVQETNSNFVYFDTSLTRSTCHQPPLVKTLWVIISLYADLDVMEDKHN